MHAVDKQPAPGAGVSVKTEFVYRRSYYGRKENCDGKIAV